MSSSQCCSKARRRRTPDTVASSRSSASPVREVPPPRGAASARERTRRVQRPVRPVRADLAVLRGTPDAPFARGHSARRDAGRCGHPFDDVRRTGRARALALVAAASRFPSTPTSRRRPRCSNSRRSSGALVTCCGRRSPHAGGHRSDAPADRGPPLDRRRVRRSGRRDPGPGAGPTMAHGVDPSAGHRPAPARSGFATHSNSNRSPPRPRSNSCWPRSARESGLRPADWDRLVERAGGNPLFAIELAGAARSQGSADALADSVESLVTSKIDTLAGARPPPAPGRRRARRRHRSRHPRRCARRRLGP